MRDKGAAVAWKFDISQEVSTTILPNASGQNVLRVNPPTRHTKTIVADVVTHTNTFTLPGRHQLQCMASPSPVAQTEHQHMLLEL